MEEELTLAQAVALQTKFLQAMLEEKEGMRNKDVAVANTGTLLHGPGGLFNTPGLDEAIISLHVRARGLASVLPAMPSNDTNPWFGFITGFSDDQGSEPVYPCDDAPTGYMKSGTLSAKYGRVSRDTNTIRWPDTVMQINRGEMTDLRLYGELLNPELAGSAYANGLSNGELLNNVVLAEQVMAGVRMERKISKLIWTGSASVATAGKGYVEPPGLDSQIATGQVDAELNVAMPSADSTIINYAYGNVETTDIVEPLEETEDMLFNLAEDTGVDPVNWVVVMRPQAWRAVSSVWPIAYNSMDLSLINANSSAQYVYTARDTIQERDDMRRGMYLMLNGRRYDVVLDNMIPEANKTTDANLGLGEFSSNIYFIPLTIVGGLPVTYMNYVDYKLSTLAGQVPPQVIHFWSDGGRFLWSYDGKFTCFKLKMETDFRVVLRAPHLAAKIQRVKYTRRYAEHRDPDPTSAYWKDGGVSLRNIAGPTRYSVW